jgi:hypothetical protein
LLRNSKITEISVIEETNEIGSGGNADGKETLNGLYFIDAHLFITSLPKYFPGIRQE